MYMPGRSQSVSSSQSFHSELLQLSKLSLTHFLKSSRLQATPTPSTLLFVPKLSYLLVVPQSADKTNDSIIIFKRI